MERLAALAAVLTLVWTLFSPAAAAGGASEPPLHALNKTVWTLADGAPPDIWALAQTKDGYLWLGTGAGLYRFDGVQFEKFTPPPGEALPHNNIVSMRATPNGDLWIGFFHSGAVTRLRDGRLTNFQVASPASAITSLFDDRSGGLWASAWSDAKPSFFHFDGKRWEIAGASWGLPLERAGDATVDSEGDVWIGIGSRLWFLPPGEHRFHEAGARIVPNSRPHLVEDHDGYLWIASDMEGMRRLPIAALKQAPAHEPSPRAGWVGPTQVDRNMVDRSGAYWGSNIAGGVFRIARPGPAGGAGGLPAIERLTAADGLPSNRAVPVLQDREGVIWVGTNLGLVRLRRQAFTVVPTPLNLATTYGSILVGNSAGGVRVTSNEAMFEVRDHEAPRLAWRGGPQFLPLCASADGAFGYRHAGAILLVKGGRRLVLSQSDPADGLRGYLRCGFTRDGSVWISDKGRFEAFRNGRWEPILSGGPALPGQPQRSTLDHQGRLWIATGDISFGYIDNGRFENLTRLPPPRLRYLQSWAPSGEGMLLGFEAGVGRYVRGRFQALDPAQIPDLVRVSGMAHLATGETWFNAGTNIVRIADQELDRAFASPSYHPRYSIFDAHDGVPGTGVQDNDDNTIVEDRQGLLWFLTNNGLAYVDPKQIERNVLPPPVSIKAVKSGVRTYEFPVRLRLTPRERNIEVDYAALSLMLPERVRYRYRLEGVDHGWVDAGGRRQAFYTQLRPGRYRFRVIAANNDGVWNDQGAVLDLDVAPRFYETWAFLGLCLLVVGVLLWRLYRWRLRQLTARMDRLFEERISERERIARELHDTLLQGFGGLMLRLRAVASISAPDSRAARELEAVLGRGEAVLLEGRERLMDLRRIVQPELEVQFRTFVGNLTTASTATFDTRVTGRPRPLQALAADEICKIGQEALSNAFMHACATSVAVEIDYGADWFVLRVRDDGVGLPPEVVKAGNRPGHFGLAGMRERTTALGGRFTLESGPEGGARITVSVPAAAAFGEVSAWTALLRRLGWRGRSPPPD